MTEGLGPSIDQRAVDKQHLDLLSVFYFVGAGLALLGIVFVGLHYALFSAFVNNDAAWRGSKGPPPAEFFAVFRWVYLVLGGWMASSLVLNLLAGVYLRTRKHRTFCFVAAAANCMHMPLGTVLGIFTIVVLVRDSVRAAFDARPHGAERID